MICSKQWDIQLEIAINGDDKRDYYTTGIIYIYISNRTNSNHGNIMGIPWDIRSSCECNPTHGVINIIYPLVN